MSVNYQEAFAEAAAWNRALHADRERLEAERDRLREALEEVRTIVWCGASPAAIHGYLLDLLPEQGPIPLPLPVRPEGGGDGR